MRPQSSKCFAIALFSLFFLSTEAFAVNAPSNLTANPVSTTQVNLAWTDNSTDEIGFTFAVDTNTSFGTASYVWTGGANVTSYAHTGRTAGTTYYYRVKAEGSTDALDSGFSNVVGVTTAPANLAATAASSSQINLTWSGNASNGSIYGYTVAMSTSASFTGATYDFVSGAGAASYSKTGLNGGTTYYFAVKAEGNTDSLDSPFTAFSSATTPTATPISPHFFGINAWMPHQIGPHVFWGKLGTQWTNIQNSGAKIMRYGGNGPDQYADPLWSSSTDSTLKQYLALVDNMQSRGIEPVLQVPVYANAYDATDAADIVRYVNITHARGVKYWSIGNEPDLQSGVYQYTTAQQVAAYFKPIASAMKAVDPTIKIIGPDTAWYNTAIIDNLLCGGTHDLTGTDANGRYYLDIVSFHEYNNFSGGQSPDDVIAVLMAPNGYNDDLASLKAKLAQCNAQRNRTGTNALKMAVTEANVNFVNVQGDGVSGTGAASFIGGQWWAEFMGISLRHGVDFVTFWSTIEGSSQTGNELGFVSGDGNTKHPSYYHFQMLAQNFRGNSIGATDNQTKVKAFASKASDQTAVLILNQDAVNFNYTVRLNTSTVSGTNPLKINVDAGHALESSGTIASASSIMLIFDANGVLKKKIEYKRTGHADANLPPSVTLY